MVARTYTQKRFPNLSQMALDILSIPVMSADPECLFSGAKITISDRRCRLGMPTIQALECLKSWLGIIKGARWWSWRRRQWRGYGGATRWWGNWDWGRGLMLRYWEWPQYRHISNISRSRYYGDLHITIIWFMNTYVEPPILSILWPTLARSRRTLIKHTQPLCHDIAHRTSLDYELAGLKPFWRLCTYRIGVPCFRLSLVDTYILNDHLWFHQPVQIG
jgi:hypothetical protein